MNGLVGHADRVLTAVVKEVCPAGHAELSDVCGPTYQPVPLLKRSRIA